MAATDGQICVAAARWADEGSYLREFVSKHRLPAVVKIIKGQYGGLGVPTLPSPGLQSTALLITAGKRHKILAQGVKIKEGRRLICVGPRLIIPDTYTGYFELLSEEGRAVRCIESVNELSKRRCEDGCLVRETIRGVQAKTDLDGNCIPEGARTISPGEILVPSGETILNGGSKGRYLKCLDQHGDTILLGLEQRGKFSILAREDNISGVHTAKNLLSKRLPITVRLVHGTAPRGLKSPNHFVPELRLLSILEEEHIFALPLQKDTQNLTALPLQAPLKLLRTRNDEQLKTMIEFNRLVDKSMKLLNDVADRIQVLDGKLGDSKKSPTTTITTTPSTQIQQNGGCYLLRRSASSDSANHRTNKHSRNNNKYNENRIQINSKDYEEIDQIYDYVRGFAPLPKNLRQQQQQQQQQANEPTSLTSHSSESTKPEPPPIETIPTKKNQAEKRNRKEATSTIREPTTKVYQNTSKTPPGLPKLYIKNGHTQRSSNRLLLRQKSTSPMKELITTTAVTTTTTPATPTPSSPLSKSGSPIFNIRYKSLNNLQQAMEFDGTLDSSNSGGRRSGGDSSGTTNGGIKQPIEKRSRKLSRPKSLTNLIWELKEHPDISMKKLDSRPILYKKHSKYSINGQQQQQQQQSSQHHHHHHHHQQQQQQQQQQQRRGTLYL